MQASQAQQQQGHRDFANEFSRVASSLSRLEVWEVETSTVFTHLLLTYDKLSSLSDTELEDAVIELLPEIHRLSPLDNRAFSVLCEGR
jgi:hypothetical protein